MSLSIPQASQAGLFKQGYNRFAYRDSLELICLIISTATTLKMELFYGT